MREGASVVCSVDIKSVSSLLKTIHIRDTIVCGYTIKIYMTMYLYIILGKVNVCMLKS